MNKLGIVIKREYLRRVSKKSFIILTILMPFLMAGIVALPLWMSRIKSSEVRTVAIIDSTSKYISLFKDTETYRFIATTSSLDEYRNSRDKSLFAILSISGDLLDNPRAAAIYSEKQIPQDLSGLINYVITKYLEDEKLASFNIPNIKEIIAESKVRFSVQTIKWEEGGRETESSAGIAMAVGFIFTMLIYMFILIYGAMVMTGVQEEKTNRIVELMVSSVRPFDLMMGKIVGIALVGLTQLILWGVMLVGLFIGMQVFLGGGIDPSAIQQAQMMKQGMAAAPPELGEMSKIMNLISSINYTEIVIYFILYFIGGYLLFAALFAAIGSAVNQAEDTQQFMMPITLLLVFALYAGIYSMENPDGPLAFWCSFIPLTSPIVMMMRLPFEVPLWEKLLSLALLYATSAGIVWLSGKIYRVGILMYGKKPSFKEIAKWVRYK
ncbi:MAG: ABC transporter permease [Tannerellaceae bacterium]|jgi:ABC-2 type transport system permease protein|nr:ABC transporter permease [Tannerellaceae bacterium]